MDKVTFTDVLYEDNHIIAVHKPAGVLVQGDDTGDISLTELVKDYIKRKYKKPGAVYLGTIHRLDRPVAGVVLFARTDKAASRLSELFRNRKVHKIYYAVTEQKPVNEEGTLINFLWKDNDQNQVYAYDKEKPGSKKAELNYQLVQQQGNSYLLQVNPLTGRPHQIRTQLSHMGCPITGDTKYGAKHSLPDRSIALLARQIEFIHPVKKTPLTIVSHTPQGAPWQKFNWKLL